MYSTRDVFYSTIDIDVAIYLFTKIDSVRETLSLKARIIVAIVGAILKEKDYIKRYLMPVTL